MAISLVIIIIIIFVDYTPQNNKFREKGDEDGLTWVEIWGKRGNGFECNLWGGLFFSFGKESN